MIRKFIFDHEKEFFIGENKDFWDSFVLSEENLLFLKEDFSFFMEICNSNFREIFFELNHLSFFKYLYYIEGRGFKEFLLWNYLNNYKYTYNILIFTQYMAYQKRNPSNFSALLLYHKKKIGKTLLNYCIYVKIF